MLNYFYLLRDGVFKGGAKKLFCSTEAFLPAKGDEIFYENVDYTVISIETYFDAKGKCLKRHIYLR